MNKSHGSAFDRGAADSYYRRGKVPHMMVDGKQVRVSPDSEEWRQYLEGYQLNESIQNWKQWGDE
jgi:hypothetical protein